MAERLVTTSGVVAVTLGGSRARGDHTSSSDVDLGLYYRGTPDVAALRDYTAELGNDSEVVTRPGEWGPWVDGGAWLAVDGVAVDWIYRDVSRVEESAAAALAGHTRRETQVGHPFGFPAHAYAAEVALSRPLADPEGVLADVRRGLSPYPPALRQALVDDLWIADFHLAAARKGVSRGDSVYVAACLSDVLLIAAHAVHGVAGRWASNEKGLVAAAGALPGAPRDFADRCRSIIGTLDADRLELAIDRAAELVAEVRANAG